jgi:hypothetical protein
MVSACWSVRATGPLCWDFPQCDFKGDANSGWHRDLAPDLRRPSKFANARDNGFNRGCAARATASPRHNAVAAIMCHYQIDLDARRARRYRMVGLLPAPGEDDASERHDFHELAVDVAMVRIELKDAARAGVEHGAHADPPHLFIRLGEVGKYFLGSGGNENLLGDRLIVGHVLLPYRSRPCV